MNAVWLAVLFIPLGLLLWFFGPREKINETVDLNELPEDLDRYLDESESRFPNIREGLKKEILWVDPEKKQQTELSIIYLHGFSASRAEISPVPEHVAMELGANLFFTRLSGHGSTGSDLGDSNADDWLKDAVEALKIGQRIGKKVVLMGTSTGGTLALWLAFKFQDAPLRALILTSPNLGLKDPRSIITLFPWPRFFVSLLVGNVRSWDAKNEAHSHAWTNHYPTGVGVSMVGLTRKVLTNAFEHLRIPCLTLYSPRDTVVHPRKIETIFDRLGSSPKRLLAILDSEDPGQHVITGDILSPSTNERVIHQMLKFLKNLG